jgi:hypothetical protein
MTDAEIIGKVHKGLQQEVTWSIERGWAETRRNILIKARGEIAEQEDWCQGDFGQDETGGMLTMAAIRGNSGSASRYCAAGALIQFTDTGNGEHGYRAMCALLSHCCPDRPGENCPLVRCNERTAMFICWRPTIWRSWS